MMNYRKGKNEEEELTKDGIPIENLPSDFLWMHVKGGTKITNVIDYAKNEFKSKPTCRTVVWTGSGGGCTKTISCAEIMKRDIPELNQLTRLCYRKVQEYWEPQIEGLEQIIATRQIPCIHILLTLDKIDETLQGHQLSQTKTTFWLEKSEKSIQQNQTNNRNQKSNHKRSYNQHQHQQQQQQQQQQHPKSSQVNGNANSKKNNNNNNRKPLIKSSQVDDDIQMV